MKYERLYGAFFEELEENRETFLKKIEMVKEILESEKVLKSVCPGFEANNIIEEMFNVEPSRYNGDYSMDYYSVMFYFKCEKRAIKISRDYYEESRVNQKLMDKECLNSINKKVEIEEIILP